MIPDWGYAAEDTAYTLEWDLKHDGEGTMIGATITLDGVPYGVYWSPDEGDVMLSSQADVEALSDNERALALALTKILYSGQQQVVEL